MNIAKVLEDSGEVREEENSGWLKKRQSDIIRTLEALRAINSSKHWKTLQELLWGGIVGSLENQLRNTSDEKQIFRLQGQLVWSQNYADLNKLIKRFENELLGINQQLHGKT